MSNVDKSKTKTCPMCSENVNNSTDLSVEYGDFHYCDNVIRTVDDPSCDITKKYENNKDLMAMTLQSTALSIHGHMIFSYLHHLATFSWQRRKRRCCKEKQQRNSATGVTIFTYVLVCLVLSSSFLASINATASSSPDNMKFSSNSPSFNTSYMSKSYFLVPSSEDAKFTFPYLFGQAGRNGKSSELVAEASRSRETIGNNIK